MGGTPAGPKRERSANQNNSPSKCVYSEVPFAAKKPAQLILIPTHTLAYARCTAFVKGSKGVFRVQMNAQAFDPSAT
jgi:hypothetical protein